MLESTSCCSDFACFSLARRSEEHTSELQSRLQLVCRLLLEKKKHDQPTNPHPPHRGPQLRHHALTNKPTTPLFPAPLRRSLPAPPQSVSPLLDYRAQRSAHS